MRNPDPCVYSDSIEQGDRCERLEEEINWLTNEMIRLADERSFWRDCYRNMLIRVHIFTEEEAEQVMDDLFDGEFETIESV